jgi:hypothetical protein
MSNFEWRMLWKNKLRGGNACKRQKSPKTDKTRPKSNTGFFSHGGHEDHKGEDNFPTDSKTTADGESEWFSHKERKDPSAAEPQPKRMEDRGWKKPAERGTADKR